MRQTNHNHPSAFRTGQPRVTIQLIEKRYAGHYRDHSRSKGITVDGIGLEQLMDLICDRLGLQSPFKKTRPRGIRCCAFCGIEVHMVYKNKLTVRRKQIWRHPKGLAKKCPLRMTERYAVKRPDSERFTDYQSREAMRPVPRRKLLLNANI